MPKTIIIVAGEASGDLLGAGLMAALREQNPEVNFVGLGGNKMQAQGLNSLFDMEELNVMGIAEALPRVPKLLKRRDQLIELARRENAVALVTIDAPDFNLRLAKKLKKKLKIPCIHYVSPSVWAWRKGRVFKMAKYLDHVLSLFPFEPEIYKKAGLKCTFVGHPVAERLAEFTPEFASKNSGNLGADKDKITVENNLKNGKNQSENNRKNTPMKIAILPGSRQGIITRMMPIFMETFELLKKEEPNLQAVIPLANSSQKLLLEPYIKGRNDVNVIAEDERFKYLKNCRFALATSGTSNLELAMLGLPMLVGYKMGKITYAIVNKLVKIPYASPVNWVAGRKIIPEFIQDEMTAEALTKVAKNLLEETSIRQKQIKEMARVRWLLGGGEMGTEIGSASRRAATVVEGYF